MTPDLAAQTKSSTMTATHSSGTTRVAPTSDDAHRQIHKELKEVLLCNVKYIFSLLVVITKLIMFSCAGHDNQYDDNSCPLSSFSTHSDPYNSMYIEF
jgi:hypothetical protein